MGTVESTKLNPAKCERTSPRVGVVTVTYNGDCFFNNYMSALAAQTVAPDLVVLVDSGSSQPDFLERVANYPVPVEIVRESNVGVCVGNNIGWRRVRDFEYVIFVNPDAFLAPDLIEKAVEYMEGAPNVGMVTPSLLRYDISRDVPTDIVDSTGVVRSWKGLIVERDGRRPAESLKRYTRPNRLPWVCTAVAMGRREAMNSILEAGDQLFDESFFMYKDDTDLSWRVRLAGWQLIHHPELRGYHCRGWQDRGTISREARVRSARNEFRMYIKHRSPFVIVGIAKYVLVRFLNV
jgi:N-acetylglucosaminyl-diphospho-decaprenol L-rhamnosyltransferase